MTEEELGALILDEVAIPALAATGIGGFLAFMIAVYISVRHVRGTPVGLLGFAAPQVVCLTVIVCASAPHRFSPADIMALYGLALPAFLALFPSFLIQSMLLVPSAFRGLVQSDRRWRAAAPALGLGLCAALAVFAGGHQVGASGETAQFHEALAFNVFSGGRALLYALAGGLLAFAALRPMDSAADVRRVQGLGLGVVLMVVAGEWGGVGIGMYSLAMFMDNLEGANAGLQLRYMTSMLRVEHVWGLVASISTFAAWFGCCRLVWVPADEETVEWTRLDRVAIALAACSVIALAFAPLGHVDYVAISNTLVGN